MFYGVWMGPYFNNSAVSEECVMVCEQTLSLTALVDCSLCYGVWIGPYLNNSGVTEECVMVCEKTLTITAMV